MELFDLIRNCEIQTIQEVDEHFKTLKTKIDTEYHTKFDELYKILTSNLLLSGNDEVIISQRLIHSVGVAMMVALYLEEKDIKNPEFILASLFHDAFKFCQSVFNPMDDNLHGEIASNLLSLIISDTDILEAVSKHSDKKNFVSEYHKALCYADICARPYPKDISIKSVFNQIKKNNIILNDSTFGNIFYTNALANKKILVEHVNDKLNDLDVL